MNEGEPVAGGHVPEEELVLLRLGESARAEEVRAHLERCAECAGRAEEIAETLRVFSGDPVPAADFEESWRRVRAQMEPHAGREMAHGRKNWFAGRGGPVGWAWAMAAAAVLLMMVGLGVTRRQVGRVERVRSDGGAAEMARGGDVARGDGDEVGRQVVDAERFLTEVNHTSGPLDAATREQAHTLLLRNAVYVQQARDRQDLGEATVLEQLGRVLTTIDAAPRSEHAGVELRLEWNTSGLLFDLRMLQQGRGQSRANDDGEDGR